jgi:hypothetical protein
MMSSDGKSIQPTNKKFRSEFCTVAHWMNGEIVEEKLFYDLVRVMKQLGLMWIGLFCRVLYMRAW